MRKVDNMGEGAEKNICMIPAIPRVKSCLLREAIMDMEPARIEGCLQSIHEARFSEVLEKEIKQLENLLFEFEYDSALELLARITEQI